MTPFWQLVAVVAPSIAGVVNVLKLFPPLAKVGGYVWAATSFVLGVAYCLLFQVNYMSSTSASFIGHRLTGWAGQTLTGVAVGFLASGAYELFTLVQNKRVAAASG